MSSWPFISHIWMSWVVLTFHVSHHFSYLAIFRSPNLTWPFITHIADFNISNWAFTAYFSNTNRWLDISSNIGAYMGPLNGLTITPHISWCHIFQVSLFSVDVCLGWWWWGVLPHISYPTQTVPTSKVLIS